MLGSVAFNVCGPLPGVVDDQIAGDQPPPGFQFLLGQDGQQLLGADGQQLYGVA